MQLYIDTNIYLDYFRTGKDSLDSLKALKILLESKKLKLLIPAQVSQEYIRNRAQIVEDTRNLLLAKKVN